MSILIRDAESGWREPAGTGYENETALQQILHDHPNLVPGVSEQAVACREFQSGAGRADVVILDTQGKLTLVECKLAANPQVRREVIGQVLDYASRMWRMDVEEFERVWRRTDGGRVSPFEELDDQDGRIRTAVKENLAAGRFNLVLAVDDLNDDVKRIVEFLNAVTVPTTGVIVVEFTHAQDGDVEILIPTAYGTDLVEAKSAAHAASVRAWKEEDFLAWCEATDPTATPLILEFLGALRSAGFQIVGGRAQTPSLNCSITSPRGVRWPVAMYTSVSSKDASAKIEVRFPDYRRQPEIREALAQGVESITGIPIPVDLVRQSDFRRRPNIPARDFTAEQLRALPTAVAAAIRGQS